MANIAPPITTGLFHQDLPLCRNALREESALGHFPRLYLISVLVARSTVHLAMVIYKSTHMTIVARFGFFVIAITGTNVPARTSFMYRAVCVCYVTVSAHSAAPAD